MAQEIDKIFTATAKSTWHFLIESGQGCYIPAYQRPYSWDKNNISRLYEDVLHGLRQLTNRPDTISFLGTIIAVHDTKYSTVDPIYRSEMAGRVMTIIDGQQRICTLAMCNIALHDLIKRTTSKFFKKKEPHLFWINEECTQVLADLRNTLLIDRASGDGNYRFYPRVIRAYYDAWSRRQGQAQYESPIARILWEYINHAEDNKTQQFKFDPKEKAGEQIDMHRMLKDAFRFIQSETKRICQSSPEKYDFPDIVAAISNSDFTESIWNAELPDHVIKYVIESGEDAHHQRFCILLRLLIFARYLNHRIAVTVVEARNDDDAFDMFEALNTTGEPLTAFETFKPKVIDMETLAKFEHSPSYDRVKNIEAYLDRYRKADEKQRATSEMLVPFALAETGWKLQKKLNDQRRYLRDEFEKLVKTDDKEKPRYFVKSLSDLASFMRYGWDVEGSADPTFYPLKVSDPEALVGINLLRGLNHSITIAPLSRFYQSALEADNEATRLEREKEFIAAIKATVAFSALWRGAKGGTENIDSCYRDIMRSGVNLPKESILHLARRSNGKTGNVSLVNYKKALRHLLSHEGKITSKDQWIKNVAEIPIYKHSKALARFLIFCAAHDSVPDEKNPGLITRGRSGKQPMLTLKNWNNEAYFTVEHIAPQSNEKGWDEKIYAEPHSIDSLGNLTLLPAEENNIIGNKKWEHKKIMYALLASDTPEEFDALKANLGSVGLSLSKNADEVLEKAKYLGLCKSIGECDKKWSIDMIEARTNRLADLAWNVLWPWLAE